MEIPDLREANTATPLSVDTDVVCQKQSKDVGKDNVGSKLLLQLDVGRLMSFARYG